MCVEVLEPYTCCIFVVVGAASALGWKACGMGRAACTCWAYTLHGGCCLRAVREEPVRLGFVLWSVSLLCCIGLHVPVPFHVFYRFNHVCRTCALLSLPRTRGWIGQSATSVPNQLIVQSTNPPMCCFQTEEGTTAALDVPPCLTGGGGVKLYTEPLRCLAYLLSLERNNPVLG